MITLNLQDNELSTVLKGLKMVEAKCSHIDHILEKEFTEEFHTTAAGVLNEKGQRLFQENMDVKLTVSQLLDKIKTAING